MALFAGAQTTDRPGHCLHCNPQGHNSRTAKRKGKHLQPSLFWQSAGLDEVCGSLGIQTHTHKSAASQHTVSRERKPNPIPGAWQAGKAIWQCIAKEGGRSRGVFLPAARDLSPTKSRMGQQRRWLTMQEEERLMVPKMDEARDVWVRCCLMSCK